MLNHLDFRLGAGMRAPQAILTIILTIALLTAALAADAQQAGKVHRIGFLRYLRCPDNPGSEYLRKGLRELGYVEGRNIIIECRESPGKAGRLPDLAAELVRRNVDVLVTEGTPASLAAKQTTSALPIVMVYVGDPVASGLVANLARPGGNLTGLTVLAPEIIRKDLELLKEVAPQISRVSVWMDATNPGQTLPDEEMGAAARLLGIRPQRINLRTATDLDRTFAETLRRRAEALLVYPLPITLSDVRKIAEFAVKNRLPTVTIHPPFAREGLLMSYSASIPDQYRRAATYVDRILKGAKPADLPVEQPTTFELIVNMKTAKELGLTIPSAVLTRADEIIQ